MRSDAWFPRRSGAARRLLLFLGNAPPHFGPLHLPLALMEDRVDLTRSIRAAKGEREWGKNCLINLYILRNQYAAARGGAVHVR